MKTLKNLFNADQFLVAHGALTPFGMAHRSQEILDKFIEENGVKVYGNISSNSFYKDVWSNHFDEKEDTHSAILLDIQPLKQCEHKEAVYVEDQDKTRFKCRDCGKPVKAKGWETV